MNSKFQAVRKFSLVVAALLFVVVSLPVQAQKIFSGEAKVIRLNGPARFSTDQKTWKNLKKGDTLKAPVIIQTAPNTVADLCLNGGKAAKAFQDADGRRDNVIRIFESSVLSIDRFAADTAAELQLDLRAGTIMGSIGKLSPGSKYEIKWTKGVAGIHSGTYIFSADGVFNVLEGSAILAIIKADDNVTTKRLAAKEGYNPTTGDISPLSSDKFPGPLTCEEIKSEPQTPAASSATPNGPTRGPGMGGALRKF